MNAENVIPYGKFTHEVAQQGGVKAYKESQKALLNAVKDKSFQDGVAAGKQELFPWLIGIGFIAICTTTYSGYTLAKDKINKKKLAKAQLAKDAAEAERILTITPLHEDILTEFEDNKF